MGAIVYGLIVKFTQVCQKLGRSSWNKKINNAKTAVDGLYICNRQKLRHPNRNDLGFSNKQSC